MLIPIIRLNRPFPCVVFRHYNMYFMYFDTQTLFPPPTAALTSEFYTYVYLVFIFFLLPCWLCQRTLLVLSFAACVFFSLSLSLPLSLSAFLSIFYSGSLACLFVEILLDFHFTWRRANKTKKNEMQILKYQIINNKYQIINNKINNKHWASIKRRATLRSFTADKPNPMGPGCGRSGQGRVECIRRMAMASSSIDN